MTAYNVSPFGPPPILMVGGRNEWLYGNQPDTISPTQFQVATVAITSNVATVIGTIVSGNAQPAIAVGNLVSIQGTKTSGGIFNVTNVPLLSVGTNLLTGAITITFTLTNANVSTTFDAGFGLVPTPITFDTLVAGSSRQAASAENDPSENDERSYMVQVFFGTLPTAVTVTLQASLVDQDSAYQNVATVATVAGGVATLNAAVYANANFKFLRFNVSGLTGTGTIAACLMG